MKKAFFGLTVLVVVLVLAGCNNNKNQSSGNVQDEDFFSKEITGEISISAFESWAYKNFLEEAALEFEALYPGTKVNVEIFSTMPEMKTTELDDGTYMMIVEQTDDTQSRADYISRTNTKIMSGTGADIFAMDILPLHKLINGGVLENLDSYMQLDPAFNKSDYRQNIFDALRYKNGTWFMPLNYGFDLFLYDASLVPNEFAHNFGVDKVFNMQKLLEMGVSLYTSGGGADWVFNQPDEYIFNRILYENIQSFANLETGRVNFTDGRFADLLDLTRTYSDQGLLSKAFSGQDTDMLIQRYMEGWRPTQYFTMGSDMYLLFQYAGMMANIGLGEDNQIAGVVSNADGSIPFTYNRAMAINSQSKNKALAWAFIKFLLSNEMQTSPNTLGLGLPINNEARYEMAEINLQAFLGGEINDQKRQALDNYRNAVELISDKINSFVMQDSNLDDMISQEVFYFFDGSRTSGEVARALQNKADLYLSE